MKKNIEKAILYLKKNGFKVIFFKNSEVFTTKFIKKIKKDKTIGIGGSQTILEINLHKKLVENGNKIYWHWLVKDKKAEVLKAAANADIYLSGSNGITEDGKIINIDGVGNRLSSLCYGHEKIYIIVGKNKISKNIEESINRIKNSACPKNALRLNLNTPCKDKKKCVNCNIKDRMCNLTLIMEKKPTKSDITVCIIDETLGF